MPALTLDCLCDTNPGVSICHLTKLSWVGSKSYIDDGCAGMVSVITLTCDGGTVSPGAPPDWDITLYTPGGDSTWLDNWGSISVEMSGNSSLFWFCTVTTGAIFSAAWSIRQDYTCIDTVTSATSTYTIFSGNTICPGTQQCPSTGDPWWLGNICGSANAGGSGTLIRYRSSPFSCEGAYLDSGGFAPPPLPTILRPSANAVQCLCASGGTGPYRYYVATGTLPSGQSLDPSTGCITGIWDGGNAGSGTVVFGVTDSTQARATAVCDVVPTRCPKKKSGNVFI